MNVYWDYVAVHQEQDEIPTIFSPSEYIFKVDSPMNYKTNEKKHTENNTRWKEEEEEHSKNPTKNSVRR